MAFFPVSAKFLVLIFVLLLSLQLASSFQWTQIGSDIEGEAANDKSGASISLSGDGTTLAVGSTDHDLGDDIPSSGSRDYGHVRVFERSGGAWVQKGSDIDGEAASDKSGVSVSLSDDGSILAIGAQLNDGAGSSAGHVRVYQYDSATSDWVQKGSDIDGEAASDKSGVSVSLSSDGSIVAIGAKNNHGDDDYSFRGHVRVHEYDATTSDWVQKGSDIDGEAYNDLSGDSVSLSSDGSIVAIGASSNDAGSADAGHVRVYQYDSTTSDWVQKGSDIDGEADGDESGTSVSLSSDGSILAIGAPPQRWSWVKCWACTCVLL